jgi:DNA-binding transcriptional regulator YiaG
MTPSQVKKLRAQLGLTQQALAELISAHRETVARWEIGTSRPTGAYLKLLEQLAEKAKKKNG